MAESSESNNLSPQDFADLQSIRGQLKAGDPRIAKIDTLLGSYRGQQQAAPQPPKPGVTESTLSEIGRGIAGIPSMVRGMFDPGTVAQRGAALFQSDQNRQQDNRSVPYRAVAGLGQSIGINAPEMEKQADAGNPRGVIGTALGDAIPVVVAYGAKQIAAKLPTKAGAGAALSQAENVAGPQTVNIEAPGQIALRMQEIAGRGANLPRVVRLFLARITDPEGTPVSFSEARDFYKNTTALSANDNLRTNPVMKMQLEMFKRALGQSIQDTANQAGVGDVHAAGMKQYAKAAAFDKAKANIVKYGVKPAIATGAAAIGAKAGYDLYNNLNK